MAVSLLRGWTLVGGMAVCFALRAHGYEIFPWPLLGAFLLSGLAGWYSNYLHNRMILRNIPQAG